MGQKYKLLECKIVAVVATKIERNIVILSYTDIANPHFRVGTLLEIVKEPSRPWHIDGSNVYLVLNGLVYDLAECEPPGSHGRQSYRYSLLEEVPFEVEDIIDKAIPSIL